jgi:hypothetical protein
LRCFDDPASDAAFVENVRIAVALVTLHSQLAGLAAASTIFTHSTRFDIP